MTTLLRPYAQSDDAGGRRWSVIDDAEAVDRASSRCGSEGNQNDDLWAGRRARACVPSGAPNRVSRAGLGVIDNDVASGRCAER